MGREREKSRIDFWILSKSLDNQVDNIEYKHAPFSDHKAIYLKFKTSETNYGKEPWKMNVNVLKSKFFQIAFKSMWQDWK